MDDAMEIDTHADLHIHRPQKPSPSGPPDEQLTRLLKAHLTNFITTHITRTLGSEYVPIYGPPPSASAKEMLSTVESRWLAVFSDSPLQSSKQLVARLRDAVSCHTPIPQLAALIEELLLVIGQPSAAAQAAHFRDGDPISTPRRSPVSRAPPPTPVTSSTQLNVTSSPLVVDTPMANDQHKFLVVLDGSNIAWRHGQSKFSMKGLLIAREYYMSRKHRTITFLPETRVTEDHSSLLGTPDIVLTPSKDYDDAYIVHYARTRMAVVVSNDEFRDVIYQASADGKDAEKGWRDWLKACRVSFTFHGDTYLPNPAFNWNGAVKAAAELRLRE